MDRLYVVTPALVLTGAMLLSFFVYSAFRLFGVRPGGRRDQRTHSNFFGFFIEYFLWLVQPIEALVLRSKLTPDSLTFTSILLAAGSGLAIATGHMATAGWLYIAAALMDILDGRLARVTGQMTRSGGFLDSIADRWSELLVLSGFAWFLRDTNWLVCALLAIAGSVMVSYTRAKGGEVGLKLDGGHLQRPERITILATGTLLTAFFEANRETAEFSVVVIGVALLLVGVGSSVTAIGRLVRGYRELRRQDRADARLPDASKGMTGAPAARKAK